jgi:hypothetical protein
MEKITRRTSRKNKPDCHKTDSQKWDLKIDGGPSLNYRPNVLPSVIFMFFKNETELSGGSTVDMSSILS